MLELVPNAEQALSTDSSQSAKCISVSVVGSGLLWVQGRAGMTGVGRISVLFSWYPQICFQKPL